MRKRRNFHWKNVVNNQSSRTEILFKPKSMNDLVEIVKKAKSKGKRIRAIGSSHSWSDVAKTDQYMVNTHKLNAVLKIDRRSLKNPNQKEELIHVEAGMSINKFNKVLDRRKRAIINMGGVDHQTLAGAVSTSTHGSGLKLPSLPGMVESILLVTETGLKQRIEPTNGITNPNKHSELGIKLIQDDDTFYSVVVGFGTMGLVYSFIIKTRPFYYITESRSMHKWKDVKEWIKDGSIHYERKALRKNPPEKKELRAVFVRVNPFIVNNNSDHSVMIIEHQELKGKPGWRTIGERTRVIWSSVLGSFSIVTHAIFLLMEKWPHKIPGNIESSFKTSKDKEYTARAHKVLFLGQVQMKEKGIDAEFAFPADNPTLLVNVVDDLIKEANEMSQRAHNKLYHNAPIGMRWVQQSKFYMSPEFGKDVVYIDTPNHSQTTGMKEIMDRYQLVQFKHGGIPHWGKVHNKVESSYIDNLRTWPHFNKWHAVYKRYNSSGMFNNPFTTRMKL